MAQFVTKSAMEAECPGVYEVLPKQFRDVILAGQRASSQNAQIFRQGFDVLPGLVNELFARLKYKEGHDWDFWKLLAAFYLVEVRIGPNSAMRAGEKIYSTMPWPPQVRSLEDALRFTEIAYAESHLRGPFEHIGGWRVESTAPGRMVMVDSSPYPCSLNEGVIAGIARAFAKQKPSYQLLDPATAKRNGGRATRYEVTFRPV